MEYESVARKLEALKMFPPKTDKLRGGKTPMKNFRCPEDLNRRIQEATAGGYTDSDVIRQTLEIGFDAKDAMGSEWWEIIKLARVADKPFGKMLGELAAEGLKHQRKKK